MAPIQIDKDSKREHILVSALSLFNLKGIDATSMSQIATEANIGKSTIYEYFKDKEELIIGTFSLWLKQYRIQLKRLIEGERDPEKKLRKIVTTAIEMYREDASSIQAMTTIFQYRLSKAEFFSKYQVMRNLYIEERKLIIDTILEGISSGLFKAQIAKDVETMAINFLAYLDGISIHYVFDKTYIDIDKQARYFVEQFISDLKA